MVNKVTLIGRLGKAPETKVIGEVRTVSKFSLATWENIRDDSEESGWRQITEWHNIVVWGQEGTMKNLKKGDLVFVEGSVKTRSYDVNDEKRYITEITGFAKLLKAQEETLKEKLMARNNTDDVTDLPF